MGSIETAETRKPHKRNQRTREKKMKPIIFSLLFGTLAKSTPVEKDEKSFSLFSLVSFPNDECLTTDPPTSGRCLTSDECTEVGGKPQGNCASSFGVCCFLSISETDTLISNNLTYIQNVGYPNFYEGLARTDQSGTWTFRLEGNADLCQIRLDFEDVVLAQPKYGTPIGTCGGTGDALTVTSSTSKMVGFNSLCGTLTGQHIYIHSSINTGEAIVEDAAVVNITLGSTIFNRRWKIKTSRIECGNPNRADEGCLQWFTELGGQFKSFNKPYTNPMMISNLLYNICIRKAKGMCGISVSQFSDNSNSFRLQNQNMIFEVTFNALAGGGCPTNSVAATGGCKALGAYTDADCMKEFIGIGRSTYCGGILADTENTEAGAITSEALPLRITVAADNGARKENTGFDLIYRQTTC